LKNPGSFILLTGLPSKIPDHSSQGSIIIEFLLTRRKRRKPEKDGEKIKCLLGFSQTLIFSVFLRALSDSV
jgi:hypothetical protein